MRHVTETRRIDRLFLLFACTVVLLGTGLSSPASATTATHDRAATGSQSGVTGWAAVGNYDQNTLFAGEGVTTVFKSRGRSHELYRGLASIPSTLKAQGWAHIGDPDSLYGYVFDAYQGPSSLGSKMFLVTTPSGKTFEYVHRLVPSELYNNSFVTISPGGQWMVAGEWETMSHLQIYPTPLLNHRSPARGGSLRLAGYVKLDHKVNDVQGCDFVTPVRLVCASDDDSRTLFPNAKPLVQIDLAAPLRGTSVKGHVVDLGSIPQESACAGTFEAEGVDFDASTGVLRVEVIQPGSCILKTTIYKYRLAGRRG